MTDVGIGRIIELNSFSCSGFYDCEFDPIIKYAIECAKKEHENVYQ
jgi:hypothetical protein